MGLQPFRQSRGATISYPGAHEHLRLGWYSQTAFGPHSPCTEHGCASAAHVTVQPPVDAFRL